MRRMQVLRRCRGAWWAGGVPVGCLGTGACCSSMLTRKYASSGPAACCGLLRQARTHSFAVSVVPRNGGQHGAAAAPGSLSSLEALPRCTTLLRSAAHLACAAHACAQPQNGHLARAHLGARGLRLCLNGRRVRDGLKAPDVVSCAPLVVGTTPVPMWAGWAGDPGTFFSFFCHMCIFAYGHTGARAARAGRCPACR